MASHWGVGPVFAREMVVGSRRWQLYAARAGYVSALLVWLNLIWLSHPVQKFERSNAMAAVGQEFFAGLVAIQMTLVLVAGPAATAGAVCVDKARGTLLHVLVTDLTDFEIVAGKLAARLAPVLGLLASGLPVLALCTLFGGLEPDVVLGAYLVMVGAAIVGCSLALCLSVCARKMHQALLGTYALLGLWVGAFFVMVTIVPWKPGSTVWNPVPIAFYVNPYALALIPVRGGNRIWSIDLMSQGIFFGLACLAGLALLWTSRRLLRPLSLAQASRPARRETLGLAARLVQRLPAPPLDDNPVLWREWHRKIPSRWMGRFWSMYAVSSTLASALVIANYYITSGGGGYGVRNANFWAAQVNAWGVAIGLLLLSVSAATTLAEERDRGSLDIIMTTPLPTWSIVWGKWWGTFAMVPRLAILPIWVAAGLAMVSGHALAFVLMVGLILAYAAAITSFGLALTTWIPNLARVVTTSVVVYYLVSVGWPILLLGLGKAGNYGDDTWIAMSLASPFFGIYTTTELSGWLGFSYSYNRYGNTADGAVVVYLWATFWIAAYGGLAASLAFATKANFDRYMGRVTEKPRLRPVFPGNPAGTPSPGTAAGALPTGR